MTVKVQDPTGRSWTVRRTVLRGRDGRGRRWRWRGPDWLADLAELIQIGELADIPVVGVIFLIPAVVILVVVLAVLLPFLVIGLAEALVVGLLFGGALAAATLFGRPILIRAEDGENQHLAWAVKGWRRSREVRDLLVAGIRAGADLRGPAPLDATLVYDGGAVAGSGPATF